MGVDEVSVVGIGSHLEISSCALDSTSPRLSWVEDVSTAASSPSPEWVTRLRAVSIPAPAPRTQGVRGSLTLVVPTGTLQKWIEVDTIVRSSVVGVRARTMRRVKTSAVIGGS